jgi:hypothetical protein
MTMKDLRFPQRWDGTPRSPMTVIQRFGGTVPSPDTHQPPPLPLPPPLTARLRLTHLTLASHTSAPCPTHSQKTIPLQGHPKLLFLCPIGLLGGRETAKRLGSLFRMINFVEVTATQTDKAEVPLKLEKESPIIM